MHVLMDAGRGPPLFGCCDECGCEHVFVRVLSSVLLGPRLGEDVLAQVVTLCFTFGGTAKLLCMVAALFYVLRRPLEEGKGGTWGPAGLF